MTCIPLDIIPDTNLMLCCNRRPDKAKRVRQMRSGKQAGHTSFSPAYNFYAYQPPTPVHELLAEFLQLEGLANQ